MNFSLVLWGILALIAVYGVYEYVNLARAIGIGNELSEAATAFERSGDYPHTMLVVGDSTAVGVGAPADASVPAHIAKEIKASVENYAVSGAVLADVVTQFESAQREQYDLVLIQAGANDIILFSDAATVRENISAVLENATQYSERVVLLTSGDVGKAPMWPYPLKRLYTYRTQNTRSIIMEAARAYSSVAYVDLYTKHFPTGDDATAYYAADGLHLSGAGYGVWAEHVRDVIADAWPALLNTGR